jgi:hypothetical protein
MSSDPRCGVCGERLSAHVATEKGPLTHPREARGEGEYVLAREGFTQGGLPFDIEHGPSYRFVPTTKEA